MVILHDAIKTIQNGLFSFFLKKEQKPVSLNKPQGSLHKPIFRFALVLSSTVSNIKICRVIYPVCFISIVNECGLMWTYRLLRIGYSANLFL